MENEKYLQTFVETVWSFGPFAYSILFLFVVSVWTNKQYKNAITRPTPPASPAEIQTYRWFFISSFVLGCGLSVFSVYWWIHTRSEVFVFETRISGVERAKTLKPSYPLIERSHPQLDDDDTMRYTFVVINEGPIKPEQEFKVILVPAGDDVQSGVGSGKMPFTIKYHGLAVESYRMDTAGAQPKLNPD